MIKSKFTIILLMLFSLTLVGQNEKKSLDFSVYNDWEIIQSSKISNDGQWVSYEANPYKGNGSIYLHNPQTEFEKEFLRGDNAIFSPNSDFIAFKIKPYTDTVRALKLKKTKKDKLPKDSLGIYIFESKKLITIGRVKSFKIAEENSSWFAYQLEKELKKKEPKDTTDSKKETKKPKKEKEFDENVKKGTSLVLFNPISGGKYTFKGITEYSISKNGKLISFIKVQNDTLLKSTIYTFDTEKEQLDSVSSELGISKKLTIDHIGTQLAFIHSADSIKEKTYSLHYLSIKEKIAKLIVDTNTATIPEKWTVSTNGRMYFSDNDQRLFFGIAHKPMVEPEDTLLEEEKVKLDLWSWTDPLLQPQQLENAEDERNRTYLSVYHIKEQKLVQLEDENLRDVSVQLKGDGDYAIGSNNLPYLQRLSWESPGYEDIYLVDVKTGKKSLIKKEIQSYINISPNGKFFLWYENDDSSWYTYNVANKTTVSLTKELNIPFYDIEHDYPQDPDPYYLAGWTDNDKYVLIYDEFDIWKLDPTGKEAPTMLTKGVGRKQNIKFRYEKLDRDERTINPKNDIYLSAFNKENKQSGYYKTSLKAKSEPQELIMDDFSFYGIAKAKNAEKLIWRKSSYKDYPDVWYSDLTFKNESKVSSLNPQQKDYKWGDVELVKWITTEGTEEEGLLYRPENYDPNKKYPMVVYFYRLSSDGLHYHNYPKPSRSIINKTFYASNDYFVFVPNIRYKTGYPGECAYNYIVSGTLAMLNKYSCIDKDRLALQGQSWGGYQVAYIITKTDMFAAASAGAPVTNMTSAYGGIRWGSGMSRMFQYEETQSRIGGTLWEKPLHYIENSPVFYAPKVNTPLLIRHNDNDGAVPWYQGIEYFVALRRLQKPVWMLNYNGAPHNEKNKSPNCLDLSIRMMQFFDHYLKDKPAPVWMTKGIPAIDKGKKFGLELEEK